MNYCFNLCIIFILSLYYLHNTKYFIYKIINMYRKSNYFVDVRMRGGLGNRIMSFAGIIILSMIYECKPLSINLNMISSIKLE